MAKPHIDVKFAFDEMSIEPNSAAPVGFRKKIGKDEATAEKYAAGILYVAPDGHVLMLRRSDKEENFAGHWALPGGGMEDGETPDQTAKREATEEMGADTFGESGPMKPLDRRLSPTGMAFHTFVQPVSDKFAPKLNDEHSGYAWAPLNALPGPMHPAVKATLTDQVGLADDMAPEAIDEFLKWTTDKSDAQDEKIVIDVEDQDRQLGLLLAYIKKNSETGHSFGIVVDPDDRELTKKFYIDGDGAFRIREIKSDSARPLPATDSALRMAIDEASVREFDRDGRMHVKISRISKANICPYRGAEIPGWEELGLDRDKIYQLFRDPEELRKGAATSNGVQILQKHTPVSADDHKPYDVVGATGTDAFFDGEYLHNSLHFWSARAIEDVKAGRKRELSMGYHYRPDMTPGNFGGKGFDGIMRDIVFNHVAIVEDGRAGPDVLVGDSTENLKMAKPTRFAHHALRMTSAAVGALLAKDAKIDLMPIFKPLTAKGFQAKPVTIALDSALKGKLAKDASIKQVADMLDSLEGMKPEDNKTADEEIDEKDEKDMEELAKPKAKDMEVEEPDANAFDAEPIKAFLREKGMGEDDINAACGMLPKSGAAKDEKEDDKTVEKKDMVTKGAMDQAIQLATDAAMKKVTEAQHGVRVALSECRPYVGELPSTLAFDSAEGVYRHALGMLNVADAKTIHADALLPILKVQKKAGDDNAHRPVIMAADAATVDAAAKIAPGIANIQVGPA